jgi:hypothetical protein
MLGAGVLALLAGLACYLGAAMGIIEYREHHPHYAAGSAPPLASSLLLAVGTALCAWAAARTQGTFRRIKTDAREAPPAGDFRADYLAVGHRGRAVASDLKVDGM